MHGACHLHQQIARALVAGKLAKRGKQGAADGHRMRRRPLQTGTAAGAPAITAASRRLASSVGTCGMSPRKIRAAHELSGRLAIPHRKDAAKPSSQSLQTRAQGADRQWTTRPVDLLGPTREPPSPKPRSLPARLPQLDGSAGDHRARPGAFRRQTDARHRLRGQPHGFPQ